jgi:hypothetical protein
MKMSLTLVAVFLLSVPAHAAFNVSSCATMRASFGPNPTRSEKIELKSCEDKALRACVRSAPKNVNVALSNEGTCQFSCSSGHYLTQGGECKASKSSHENQKKIDALIKKIQKLTKELERLQAKQ